MVKRAVFLALAMFPGAAIAQQQPTADDFRAAINELNTQILMLSGRAGDLAVMLAKANAELQKLKSSTHELTPKLPQK